jgi:hypothetical protein
MSAKLKVPATKFSSYIDSDLWNQVGEREKQTGKTKRELLETAIALYLSIPVEIEQEVKKEVQSLYYSKLRRKIKQIT